MEREGEEEEAAVDQSQNLAMHSARRCWGMLRCEQLGYSQQCVSGKA